MPEHPDTSAGHPNSIGRIAIIGAGIGGLSAALAFARRGASVQVYEQAPELTEVGAGLQITPNGARVLSALGVSEGIEKRSLLTEAVEPMDALTGRRITRFDVKKRADAPYRFLHRADLIAVLADACRAAGVIIHTNARIDGDLPQADLIVGADGIKSKIRQRLNGDDAPFFTGQVAWRALVPHDEDAPIARVWMAPKKHIVTYPVPGGRLNIVAVQERQQWAKEGWQHADEPGNLRHAFRDVSGRIKGILAKVDDVHLWGLFRHDVAQRWSDGNICILGDAAHPTLPFLAQGANLALEDAWVLAACCDGEVGIAGLTRYQELRRSRVVRAINAANSNAQKFHLSGIPRTVAHLGLRGLGAVAPDMYLRRLDWLYGYDATAV